MEVEAKATLGTVSFANPCASEKPIFLSAMPKELLEQLPIGERGPQALAEEAFRALLNQRKKRVPLNDFDLSEESVAKEAKKLDVDGDGFLTFREMEMGFKALHDQKVRTRQLIYLLGILFISVIILIGGTFGVVWLVVDIHKDMAAANGQLVSRADGTPLQVASADFYVQDGVLTQRTAPISTTGLDPNTTIILPQSSGDNTIKTSRTTFTFDSINSAMSNLMIQEMQYVSISSSTDANAPFLRAAVNAAVRIPNMGGPGDGSVVLMTTDLGEFILNGSNVSPASAEIASMDLPNLYQKVIGEPVARRRQSSGRRQIAKAGDTTCNRQNACPPTGTRRSDETQCCLGQIFDCQFNTFQSYYCPPVSYCPSSATQIPCTDLIFDGSTPKGTGTYSLYANAWNGFPIYVNSDANTALVYYDATNGWAILPSSVVNGFVTGQTPPSVSTALDVNFRLDPTVNWAFHSVSTSGSTKYQVHCPGSLAQAPYVMGDMTKTAFYATPYFRMCAVGFVCPNSKTQLLCDNIALSIATSSYSYSTYSVYIGTYTLSSKGTINGYPYYTSGSNLRLSFTPTKTKLVNGFPYSSVVGGWSFAYITKAQASPLMQWQLDEDPKTSWPNGVTVVNTGDYKKGGVHCPTIPSPVPMQLEPIYY